MQVTHVFWHRMPTLARFGTLIFGNNGDRRYIQKSADDIILDGFVELPWHFDKNFFEGFDVSKINLESFGISRSPIIGQSVWHCISIEKEIFLGDIQSLFEKIDANKDVFLDQPHRHLVLEMVAAFREILANSDRVSDRFLFSNNMTHALEAIDEGMNSNYQIYRHEIARIAVKILAAYFQNRIIDTRDVPQIVGSVIATLETIVLKNMNQTTIQNPAVPITNSIYDEYLVCLEDGRRMKVLTRYLKAKFDLTPDQYRKKWGLPEDYPMAAPSHTRKINSYKQITNLKKSNVRN